MTTETVTMPEIEGSSVEVMGLLEPVGASASLAEALACGSFGRGYRKSM